jgi:hypothetical protein
VCLDRQRDGLKVQSSRDPRRERPDHARVEPSRTPQSHYYRETSAPDSSHSSQRVLAPEVHSPEHIRDSVCSGPRLQGGAAEGLYRSAARRSVPGAR